jgi:ABC-type multidrug transport system fused ATPase/permease subunit
MRGIGAGMRIFEVLDRSPAVPYGVGEEVPKDQLGVVKFERIHFEYPSRKGVEILKDFNLELGVGESVVIVYEFPLFFLLRTMVAHLSDSGASGGGKSSVHSLLLRYYDPIHGKITYDGKGLIFSQKKVSPIFRSIHRYSRIFHHILASDNWSRSSRSSFVYWYGRF